MNRKTRCWLKVDKNRLLFVDLRRELVVVLLEVTFVISFDNIVVVGLVLETVFAIEFLHQLLFQLVLLLCQKSVDCVVLHDFLSGLKSRGDGVEFLVQFLEFFVRQDLDLVFLFFVQNLTDRFGHLDLLLLAQEQVILQGLFIQHIQVFDDQFFSCGKFAMGFTLFLQLSQMFFSPLLLHLHSVTDLFDDFSFLSKTIHDLSFVDGVEDPHFGGANY